MPYGWDNPYPPQGNNYAFPPNLYQQQQNGQQTQYTRPVAGHQERYQHQNQNGYLPALSLPQTQYTTPYDQGRQSFYQSPSSPPIHYQQQPYQSPTTPQNHFPPAVQYSPDPLQNWQNPPQSHRQAAPSHQGYQQQQRRPSVQPSNHQRPDLLRQSSTSESSKFPPSPYAPNNSNVASVARNSQLPHQQHLQQQQRQTQHTPSQPDQHPSGPARPASQNSKHPQQRPNQHQHQHQHQQQRRQQEQQQFQAVPPAHPPTTVNPQDVHRKVAHVQLPVQRTPHRAGEYPMARSPKRRKSNEGHIVPVEPPVQARPQPARAASSHWPKIEQVESSPLTELASSQVAPTPATSSTIDNQAVLLSLSDEYISAAYSMCADLTTAEVDEEQLDHYHSLLATGMACLDSVLKNYRITDARKEARIRLRLSSLLFEETDNDLEAEECLSKGISSCERSRLPDLKYAMHHLLARVWFKGGKMKAAMKAVEKLIVEVEKLNLVHWIYAFRFLRVSFGLQIETSPGETAVMVKHLAAITDTAAKNHHNISVQIVASTISAMIHLRSRSPDSVDSAQRDLAAARTHQLSSEMNLLPQAKALLDCLDLACSLVQVRPGEQATFKTQVMQANLDSASREGIWKNEHRWSMPLGKLSSTSSNIEADSYGIFNLMPNGESALNFTWLNQTQVYATGFLLSGLSAMHHNATNELKAEQFLSEGVKLTKQILPARSQSVISASAQASHQSAMLVVMRLYLVFAFCGRSAWESGLNGIAAIRRDVANWSTAPDEATNALLTYLEALCKHGMGEFDAAIRLYRSPELALDPAADVKPSTGVVDPIKILASLNSVLIMRTSKSNVEAADRLLAQLEPHCVTHTNSNGNEYGSRAVEAAFNILKATSSQQTSADSMIIKTKQYLQSAVHGAKITLNNQLLCVVMNLMTKLFFANIVGEQAEKSAKAGRSLAKKSNDKLWTAVADRMYADTLVRCGKSAEAHGYRLEAQQTMQQLPRAVKVAFQQKVSNANGMI